jgi:hypothetical protein
MHHSTLAALGFVAVITLGCGGAEPAPDPIPEPTPDATLPPPAFAVTGEFPCVPVGEIQFICDMVSPEDLAVIPGSEWIIASGAREGGRLHLINASEKTATLLFPTPQSAAQFDSTTYASCPGPLDLAEPDASRHHGLYLKPGADDLHTLYDVHHGSRESVEVFEVNAASEPPTLTWIGCAPAPEGEAFNSVVGLPDGGIAATSGGVWEWQMDTGWTLLPESEDTAPNGLEVSADGRFLYIAGWAEEKLTRLSRGQTPIQKDVVQLGFRPDNVRMSADGAVIRAAGHTDKDGLSIVDPREPTRETTNVATIDPETLDVERVFVHPAIDGFVASTTAIQIGDEMWLGSYRGDRVAYFPAPE